MNLLKDTFYHWKSHNASRMGASLAYYSVFAMVPLFLLLINVGIFFFNKSIVEHEIVQSFSNIAGIYLEGYFRSIVSNIPNGLGILSILINLAIAIGVFSILRNDINELWDLKKENISNSDIIKKTKNIIKDKIISFSVIPVLAFFMIISITIGILYSNLKDYLNIYNSDIAFVAKTVGIFLSFIFSTTFFSIVYRIFPKVKLPWGDVLRGAFVTSILFFIGNILIGLYLNAVSGISIFGVVGAFAILLAWIYYSAQVFFIGASFTYIYSRSKGYLNNRI